MKRALSKEYQRIEQRHIGERTVILYRLRKAPQNQQIARICVDFLQSIARDTQPSIPS